MTSDITCPTCNGTRKVSNIPLKSPWPTFVQLQEAPCPTCGGTGTIRSNAEDLEDDPQVPEGSW